MSLSSISSFPLNCMLLFYKQHYCKPMNWWLVMVVCGKWEHVNIRCSSDRYLYHKFYTSWLLIHPCLYFFNNWRLLAYDGIFIFQCCSFLSLVYVAAALWSLCLFSRTFPSCIHVTIILEKPPLISLRGLINKMCFLMGQKLFEHWTLV